MTPPETRCPACAWAPDGAARWACEACEEPFDAFALRARCPRCALTWNETRCPACRRWSPHEDWYPDAEARRAFLDLHPFPRAGGTGWERWLDRERLERTWRTGWRILNTSVEHLLEPVGGADPDEEAEPTLAERRLEVLEAEESLARREEREADLTARMEAADAEDRDAEAHELAARVRVAGGEVVEARRRLEEAREACAEANRAACAARRRSREPEVEPPPVPGDEASSPERTDRAQATGAGGKSAAEREVRADTDGASAAGSEARAGADGESAAENEAGAGTDGASAVREAAAGTDGESASEDEAGAGTDGETAAGNEAEARAGEDGVGASRDEADAAAGTGFATRLGGLARRLGLGGGDLDPAVAALGSSLDRLADTTGKAYASAQSFVSDGWTRLASDCGEARIKARDHAAAIAECDRILARSPDHARARFNRARARLGSRDLDGAAADLAAVPLDGPDLKEAPVRLLRGYVALVQERHEAAIADLTEAIRLAPRSFWAYCHRGHARLDADDPRGALADFEEAARLDPESARIRVLRAWAHSALDDVEAAVQDTSSALRRDPTWVEAYALRALNRLDTEGSDAALRDARRATRLGPEEPIAYSARAWVHLRRRELREAVTDAGRALALDPDTFRVLRLLRAWMCSLSGDLERARHELDRYPAGAEDRETALYGALWSVVLLGEDPPALEEADPWPAPIVRRLRGDLDDEALLAAANEGADFRSRRRRAEALALLADRRLAGGEDADALWDAARAEEPADSAALRWASLRRDVAAGRVEPLPTEDLPALLEEHPLPPWDARLPEPPAPSRAPAAAPEAPAPLEPGAPAAPEPEAPPTDAAGAPEAPARGGGDGLLDQLERLARLRDQGLLSDGEFAVAKRRLLDG